MSILGEIQMTLNSTALDSDTVPLDTLIKERTGISTTGVGNTIFSSTATTSLTQNSYHVLAKFIPQMTGIHKLVFTASHAGGSFILLKLPALNPVFNTNGSTTASGIFDVADIYNTFAVGAAISGAALLAHLNLVKTFSLTGWSGTSPTILLSCERGVPCILLIITTNLSTASVTTRTVTYGND